MNFINHILNIYVYIWLKSLISTEQAENAILQTGLVEARVRVCKRLINGLDIFPFTYII